MRLIQRTLSLGLRPPGNLDSVGFDCSLFVLICQVASCRGRHTQSELQLSESRAPSDQTIVIHNFAPQGAWRFTIARPCRIPRSAWGTNFEFRAGVCCHPSGSFAANSFASHGILRTTNSSASGINFTTIATSSAGRRFRGIRLLSHVKDHGVFHSAVGE